MKLPRDLSGAELIKLLCKHHGYRLGGSIFTLNPGNYCFGHDCCVRGIRLNPSTFSDSVCEDVWEWTG